MRAPGLVPRVLWGSYYEPPGLVLRLPGTRTTRPLGSYYGIPGLVQRDVFSDCLAKSVAMELVLRNPGSVLRAVLGLPGAVLQAVPGFPGVAREPPGGLLRVPRGFLGPQEAMKKLSRASPPTSPGASCEVSQCLSKSLLRISRGHLGVPGREDPWSVGIGAVVELPLGNVRL